MFILLGMLIDRMEKYRPKILRRKFLDQQYSSLRLLPHSINDLQTDAIYLTDSFDAASALRVVENYEKKEDLCVVFVGADAETHIKYSCIAMETEMELSTVMNEMQSLLEQFHSWENAMNMGIIQNRTPQDFLEMSVSVIEAPLALYDPSLKLICLVDFGETDDPIFQELQTQHTLSPKTVSQMAALKYFPNDFYTEQAQEIGPDALSPYNRIMFPIVLNGSLRTVLYVPFSAVELTYARLELIKRLHEKLSLVLAATSALERSTRLEYEYLFLDLLQQKDINLTAIESRASFLMIKINAPYFLLRMDFPDTNHVPLEFFLSRLSDMHALSKAFVHEDSILVLVGGNCGESDPNRILEEYLQSLRPILKENNLTCGISAQFHSLLELPAAYLQAVKAEQIGKMRINSKFVKQFQLPSVVADNEVFQFADLVSFYVTMCAMQSMNGKYLCDQKLLELVQYTQSAKSNPIQVLYAYLQCNGKLNETANLLFMHRNSIIYHVRKMENLLQTKLDDADARLKLMQSFEVLILSDSIPGIEDVNTE